MPDRNKAAEAARLSRRSMLMGAAGAGAAGVAAATLGGAVLPALAAGASPAARSQRADHPQADRPQADDLSAADLAEPVVVHVRDAARGELEIFRGTAATRLQDRDLAARLVRASTS